MSSEYEDLLLLLNIVRLSYDKQYVLYEEIGIRSIKELRESLYNLPFSRSIIEKLSKRIDKTDIDKYKDRLLQLNIHKVHYTDLDYPENLIHIQNPPPILYYKGILEKTFNKGVSVVGSRKCTDYGKYVCEKLVRELSYYKIPIISGLALGIDGIAHRAALDNDNKTLGVLGNGIDQIYPKSNRALYSKMESNGCIVSEFPLGSDPKPYNFPQRNRIISGIGTGVLVIEAQEKSGTLLTATAAGEQGREVFAVPGNIFSQGSSGTNKLIQDGAKLVMNVEDILNELPYEDSILQTQCKEEINEELSGNEKSIFQSLMISPKNCDELCFEKDMAISEVLEIITSLELKGLIGMIGDNYSILK